MYAGGLKSQMQSCFSGLVCQPLLTSYVPSAFVYFRRSWSCYFDLSLGLGFVSSGLDLGLGLVILVLVSVLRIWSCLHH